MLRGYKAWILIFIFYRPNPFVPSPLTGAGYLGRPLSHSFLLSTNPSLKLSDS